MKQVGMACLAALVVSMLLLPASPAVRAEETTCDGSLGVVTVDNLRVPQGATCTLAGTKVEGTIKVENNATLIANDVDVIGNIQAEGAASVKVAGSIVGGSIQIKQGGSAEIDDVRVNADIQFDSNNGLLSAIRNTVGGSIQVFQNTGDVGVLIADNTVDGNLQCKENQPLPTGGNNIVQGNAEDQCADLNVERMFFPMVILVGPVSAR